MAVLTWPPSANGTAAEETTSTNPTIPADPTNLIDPSRFRLALESLPLDTIHTKAAEIRNSITHLRHSNEQMLPFAGEGDSDCREAMFENLTVIGRMNERLGMLRAEVEGRGQMWVVDPDDLRGDGKDGEGEEGSDGMNGTNEMNRTTGTNGDGVDGGHANGEHATATVNSVTSGEVSAPRVPSGRLTDEDLRRQLSAQMDEDEDDGVHL